MHRVASFLVSFLFSPSNWIILLLIVSFIFRKPSLKKVCRISALVVFLIFSNQWLLDSYAKKWQPAPVDISSLSVFGCGIVPGGFASPDEKGNGYFNFSSDRFIQAEKLYKLGIIKHILISGGNGKINDENFREGKWVKNELTIMGIPDSVIFVEDKSNNTEDNARYAKQLLDSLKLTPPFLLITSAIHAPRASLLFTKAGLPNVSFPCNYIAGRGSFTFASLIPQASVLFTWDMYLKETIGFFWYKLKS